MTGRDLLGPAADGDREARQGHTIPTHKGCGDLLQRVTERAERAEAQLAEARRALPDPVKLRLLADWLDKIDDERGVSSIVRPDGVPNPGEDPRQVQVDLRRWADLAEGVL